MLIIGSAVSCRSTQNANSIKSEGNEYEQLAKNKLGEDVTFISNEDNSFVLCIAETKGTTKQPRNSIKYVVIKTSSNTISFENTVNGGSVKWYNQKMIQVYLTPGIMRKDQTRDDFITLYNVETGKSYPKNQKETH